MSVGQSSHSEKDNGVSVQAETQDIFTDDNSLDPIYKAKARILNDALQEIGMGKYQVSSSYLAAPSPC